MAEQIARRTLEQHQKTLHSEEFNGKTSSECSGARQSTSTGISSNEIDSAKERLESGPEQESSAVSDILNMRLDRRELQWYDLVGTGSTADVFEGWLNCADGHANGHCVAIKRLSVSEGCSARLEQECALLCETGILSLVSHDNVLKLHGLVFDEQPYLLITELCNGGTCFDLLHENESLHLKTKQQLKICCDVANAMNYLHQFTPQIIHRDVKSMNLLLVEPVSSCTVIPHVKVCDFGFSRIKPGSSGWGKMSKRIGTINWMAPEVATGNYDEKIDVYSFAMVLFEVISEEVPFEDLDPSEVFEFALQEGRPELEAIPPWTPSDLVELMVQCWEHQPSNRPSFHYISRKLDDISKHISG